MAYSSWGLSEAEQADIDYAQSLRSTELADDLKVRISNAVSQWLSANNVQLEDPMWASFGARSQECLECLIVGRLNDCCDEIARDYLETSQ